MEGALITIDFNLLVTHAFFPGDCHDYRLFNCMFSSLQRLQTCFSLARGVFNQNELTWLDSF